MSAGGEGGGLRPAIRVPDLLLRSKQLRERASKWGGRAPGILGVPSDKIYVYIVISVCYIDHPRGSFSSNILSFRTIN